MGRRDLPIFPGYTTKLFINLELRWIGPDVWLVMEIYPMVVLVRNPSTSTAPALKIFSTRATHTARNVITLWISELFALRPAVIACWSRVMLKAKEGL